MASGFSFLRWMNWKQLGAHGLCETLKQQKARRHSLKFCPMPSWLQILSSESSVSNFVLAGPSHTSKVPTDTPHAQRSELQACKQRASRFMWDPQITEITEKENKFSVEVQYYITLQYSSPTSGVRRQGKQLFCRSAVVRSSTHLPHLESIILVKHVLPWLAMVCRWGELTKAKPHLYGGIHMQWQAVVLFEMNELENSCVYGGVKHWNSKSVHLSLPLSDPEELEKHASVPPWPLSACQLQLLLVKSTMLFQL
jgi:hypothetical protein